MFDMNRLRRPSDRRSANVLYGDDVTAPDVPLHMLKYDKHTCKRYMRIVALTRGTGTGAPA